MRTLLLMRHAKSDWGGGQPDHDRPLNPRGRRDAPRMGEWVREQVGVPDRILSSTAERAISTAQKVALASGFDGGIVERRDLYLASAMQWLGIVMEEAGDAQTLLTVSHNPGVEEIVELLVNRSERMPTAAIACFRVDGEWDGLLEGICRLEAVGRPKELPAG